MIPGPLFSLPMLLLLLAPFVGVVLTALWLLRAALWWLKNRPTPAGLRPRFWTWPVILMGALALLGDGWGIVLLHYNHTLHTQHALQQHFQQSRRHFVLPRDFLYGEFVFPQGSLIDRYDASDNGEAQRPLGLRGLQYVRFPQPVRIAGVWATALETNRTLELARDQRIGPIYHFDPQAEDGYGAWVRNLRQPTMECRQGDHATLHVPRVEYDIQAEFVQGPPDGAQARFYPSQWGFTGCESGQPPLPVPPAYTPQATPHATPHAAPGTDADGQASVWGPLLPLAQD